MIKKQASNIQVACANYILAYGEGV